MLLPTTLLNVDQFSKFFYQRTRQQTCKQVIIKDPTNL